MRKVKVLLYLLFINGFVAFAQIPNGYYNNATSSGYTLKTQLRNIISNGHSDQGYSALYDAYEKTDTDAFYEKDNTVLDMYSENPNGKDPYNYNHGIRKCGNYNGENVCYNREHIFPQGFFNERSPMRADIHHVVPTDGSVNGRRSNFPFGEVNNASWTSRNGSKVGNNTFGNYNGTVFEPLDEFKGDIARMLFYFATRYENEVTSNSWDAHTKTNNPLNGTNNQVYETWYIQLLYKWHKNDPVSEREIVRNNEAYTFQGNRNPFIDHPEFVAQIWDTILATRTISNLSSISVYPNPTINNTIFITKPSTITIDNITLYSVIGKTIYKANNTAFKDNSIRIDKLNKGIYLLKLTSKHQTLTKKIVVE